MAGSATITGTQNYIMGIGHPKTEATTEAPPSVFATDPLTGRITALVSGTSSIPIGNYLQSTMPVGLPPSGSVGNNGALTLGTALDAIYSGGVWLYFPAGALFSGSAAGVYYTVMSSTTVGTIYADVLGSNTSKPSSPTPIVATGPGAYTTPTGSNITLISTAIAAGAFGSFGGFQGTIVNANNTTAGGKLVRMLLNGINVGGATSSTTSPNSQNIVFQNTGAVAENYVFFQNFTTSGVGQASSITAINTSLDMTLVVAANLVVATDWAIVRTAIAAPLGNV